MKIVKKGKFIYFYDYSEKELDFLDKILSFYEKVYLNNFIKKKLHKFLFYDNGEVYTYFGYKDYIVEYAETLGISIEYTEDKKDFVLSEEDLNKIKYLGNYELRDYQIYSVLRCLQERFGTVISATGSGKSLVIGSLVKYINKPTLIVVPTVQLAEQLYKNFLEYGFDKNNISILQSRKIKVNKFNIGVINTVINIIKNNDNILKDIKVYIVDEAQYRQAETYRKVDAYFNDKVEYAIGFTGTIYRYSKTVEQKKKLEDWISYGLTGREPIVNIDYKFLLNKKVLSVPYMYIETINHPKVFYKQWRDVFNNLIIKNDKRNEVIAKWINFFYERNVNPILILTDTISHINEMSKFLSENLLFDSIAILGNKTILKYEFGEFRRIKIFDYNDIVERIKNNEFKIVFGSPVIQAGFDLPEIRAMILAYSGKSEVKVLQRIGRGLRKTENKDKVFIIDFYDNTHYFLQSHSRSRIRLYKENEFPIMYSSKNEEIKYRILVEKEFDKVV